MNPQVNPELPKIPVAVPRADKPRRRARYWALGSFLLLCALAAGAVYLWRQGSPALQRGGAGGAAVRTAAVGAGNLEKTLRLSGVTVAERYSSLTVPQLRGRRGGGVTVVQGGRGMTVTISSGGGGGGGGGDRGGSSGGSSSGSGDSSASSGDTGTSTAAVASTAGQGAQVAGFRQTSNRFGGSSSSSSSSSSASSSSSSSSRSSSSSTSSSASSASSSGGSSGGGGGGGGDSLTGGSDFMQVLEKAKPAGSLVKKGDVVAEFDRQFQLLRLDDYRATVEQSERGMKSIDQELRISRLNRQQQIDAAKAAVEKAKLDIKTTPVLSAIQAETLKLRLEEAEAQLKQLQTVAAYQEASERASRRVSEIDFQTARSELRRAEDNINRMIVRAPMDGMLVMQNMMRGSDMSQIREGDQLFPGMMFAQIVDPSSMLVSASVNQTDVEAIRIGQRATLRFDAYPGLTLPAHVMAIGAMTKSGGQRTDFFKEIPVFLKIDQMDPRVIPDLSVSVDVVVAEASAPAVAPIESLFREEGAGSREFVFVKTASGFEKREIEVALRNHVRAAIVSGLKEGEVVALERPPAAGGTGEKAGVGNG
jgi:biotin carboxyl carrier protein/LysM repeat protein